MYQNFEVMCGKLNVLVGNMGKNGSNVLSYYKYTVLTNLVTLKKTENPVALKIPDINEKI